MNLRRIIVFVIFLAVIAGCSHTGYIPCQTYKPPEQIESEIIPVENGNKWIYKTDGEYKDDTATFEVQGIDTLYYYDDDGRQSIRAHKVVWVEKSNMAGYWIKCENAVVTAVVEDTIDMELKSGLTVYENPHIGIEPNYYKHFVWDTASTEVPLGHYKCWLINEWIKVTEYTIFRIPIDSYTYLGAKRYYHKGIGLIKIENYDENGNNRGNMKLIDYELK